MGLALQSDAAHGQDRPASGADLAYLGGNALLGGLVAVVAQSGRGEPLWDAFLRGSLGGAVSYAGKRLAAAHFSGAELVGRELAAVGASVVRNASLARGAFAEVVLPLGVARLYLWPSERLATIKLDVPTTLATIYLIGRSDAAIHWSKSFSAGSPVFYTREPTEGGWRGYQFGGAIWLQGDPLESHPDAAEPEVLRHERIHVLQYDFVTGAIPADNILTDHLPGGSWIERHLDLGVSAAGWGLLNTVIPHEQRPWEIEANHLSGGGGA